MIMIIIIIAVLSISYINKKVNILIQYYYQYSQRFVTIYSTLNCVKSKNDKNTKGTFAGVTIILSEWKIKIR